MYNILHKESSMDIEDYATYGAHWWRFSEYTVEDGRIVPGSGAKLTRYDPWDGFTTTAERDAVRLLKRPYLDLLEISVAADAEDVLKWCKQFGLLGLFFTQVREVNLYPRWKEGLPSRRRFIHSTSGWVYETLSDAVGSDIHLLPGDAKPGGGLVPKEYWSKRFGQPGVIIQNRFGEIERVPLGEYMGVFFPSISQSERETYPYPNPLSEEFWRWYSEPVDVFLQNAKGFAQAVQRIARIRPLSEISGPEQHELRMARENIMRLAAQAPLALFPEPDGTYKRESITTSLIAACGQMVLQDAQNGRLNMCGNCERVFVSSAGRARFCSDRCRKAKLQREWRARKTR